MKNIAIYSRKSKDTDKGESIKNQIQMCKDYFARYNEDCEYEVFQDEGFSGKNIDRPSFQRMMILAKHNKFDIVACYRVDRISRNIVDFMNTFDILEKHNVSLVSISEGFDPNTPGGKMMLIMLGGFAEMERMNIAQRVKDNMQSLAQIGRWSGGTTPTGYKSIQIEISNKIETYLELIPEWKDKIKNVFEYLAKGNTIRQSAKILNLPNKTVANIVNNPVYCTSDELSMKYLQTLGYKVFGELDGHGYLSYNRRPRAKNGKKLYNSKEMFVAVSKHEAIVDSALWIAANEQIKKRGQEARPRISQNSFLSHLVKCNCGSGMYITPGNKRKDGSRTFYFVCSAQRYNKSKCDSGWINANFLEEDIIEFLKASSKDKNYLIKYISKKADRNVDQEIKILKKKIETNNKKIDNLTDNLTLLVGSAAISAVNKMNEISKENERLNDELLTLERENLLSTFDKFNIDILQENIIKHLDIWNNLSNEEKQLAIKDIIKEILWHGGNDFEVKFNI